MGKPKARFFTFLLYPDSLKAEGWEKKQDWLDELETKLNIPMAISPLHDRDKQENVNLLSLNDEETELYNQGKLFKKAHYHVMYMNPNPVTADSVRDKIQRKLGKSVISQVRIIDNPENMYKYLTHESKDAIKKNKTKYDVNDIVELNNFDLSRYITLDQADKDDMIHALTQAIKDNMLVNMLDLDEFVEVSGEEIGVPDTKTMKKVVGSKLGLVYAYLNGAYQRHQKMMQVEQEKKEIDKAIKEKDELNELIAKQKAEIRDQYVTIERKDTEIERLRALLDEHGIKDIPF